MKSKIKFLEDQNKILSDQLNEANAYVIGFSLNPRINSLGNIFGTRVLCDSDMALSLLMKFLIQGNCSIQFGSNAGLTVVPLHNMNVFLNPKSIRPILERQNSSILVVNDEGVSFLKKIPPKGVDSVFIFDFIFNLTREEGLCLIEEANRVARNQVVISNIHPDHINTNPNLRSVDSNVIKQHSSWSPKDFPGAAVIEFAITSNPNCIDYDDLGFFAIIHPENIIDKSVEFATNRLIILSEPLPDDFKYFPNDLIIGDIKLINDPRIPKNYFIPMYLTVIANNLDLPLSQLRTLIANFSLLESYVTSYKNVYAKGYDAKIVEKYIKSLHE